MPLYCTFRLGELELGVDVLDVQEVIRHQPTTPVPLAPRAVTGLINLRGQIVTAVDVRVCFGMPPRDSDRLPLNVVLRTDGGSISLLVDEIGDVVEVDADSYERPPENLSQAVGSLVRGVHKLDRRLLLVLDVAAVLGRLDTARAA